MKLNRKKKKEKKRWEIIERERDLNLKYLSQFDLIDLGETRRDERRKVFELYRTCSPAVIPQDGGDIRADSIGESYAGSFETYLLFSGSELSTYLYIRMANLLGSYRSTES